MTTDKLATHDRTALFKTWLQEHAAIVYKIVHAFASTDADREDLIQEVLLELWISAPRFQGGSKSSTWVYRVALNTALAWKRKERKRPSPVPLLEIDHAFASAAPDSRNRDDALVAALYAAIRALPKVDAALVMLYLDDLGYREIAEVLGISESNVGVRLHRIKKVLADLIHEVPHGSL